MKLEEHPFEDAKIAANSVRHPVCKKCGRYDVAHKDYKKKADPDKPRNWPKRVP